MLTLVEVVLDSDVISLRESKIEEAHSCRILSFGVGKLILTCANAKPMVYSPSPTSQLTLRKSFEARSRVVSTKTCVLSRTYGNLGFLLHCTLRNSAPGKTCR